MNYEWRRVVLDSHVVLFDAGRIALGGSPRRLSHLNKSAQELVARLRGAGPGGVFVRTEADWSVAQALIKRALVHRVPATPAPGDMRPDVDVVIPTRGRVAEVERLLVSLNRANVLVVDDASDPADQLAAVVERHHGRIVRHLVNTGPAGARNTGIRHTQAPFIAFLDSDCIASPSWPDSILEHFEDPNVGMVASRVIHRRGPSVPGSALDWFVDDYETCHGALDAGPDSGRVGPGSAIRSVPSAAIVVRRSAVDEHYFDEDLRIGEDLDLILRLCDSGWVIRHEPMTVIEHESMTHFPDWIRRRFQYGTFAGPILRRHPQSTAQTMEWWAVALAALSITGHPVLATTIAAYRFGSRWWSIRSVPNAGTIAATITGQEITQEWADLSQALRSAWWPVGAIIIVSAARSSAARRASVIVLAPVLLELVTHRPRSSAVAHSLLGMLDQAAVGTGIVVSLARSRRLGALLPRVRMPRMRNVSSR